MARASRAGLLLAALPLAVAQCDQYFKDGSATDPLVTIVDPVPGAPNVWVHRAGGTCTPPTPPPGTGCHRYIATWYEKCSALTQTATADGWVGKTDAAGRFAVSGDNIGVLKECAGSVTKRMQWCYQNPQASCTCPEDLREQDASLRKVQRAAVDSFSKYPGSSTALTVVGTTTLAEDTFGVVNYTWQLQGVDPACTAAVANACGVHVHEGSDCTDQSTIGGHYYDAANFAADPWLDVRYVSGAAGDATIRVGYDIAGLNGRSLVVHDATGARIACGKIVGSAVASFATYPGYAGALSVSGSVALTTPDPNDPTMIKYAWAALTGADTLCTSSIGNACGVHVHEGMDCTDKNTIGGHYYDSVGFSQDPFTTVKYVASAAGSADGSVTKMVGKTLAQISNRTFIVHDATGARVACGLIKETVTSAPSAAPSQAPQQPSRSPSQGPQQPSRSPSLSPMRPSVSPSKAPQKPAAPSMSPSRMPTSAPVKPGAPTRAPVRPPSRAPTSPSRSPSGPPTSAPVLPPTKAPSSGPVVPPTVAPYKAGTPSAAPAKPTAAPTGAPTGQPLRSPTATPSAGPYKPGTPSRAPDTSVPTMSPSSSPPTGVSPTQGPARRSAAAGEDDDASTGVAIGLTIPAALILLAMGAFALVKMRPRTSKFDRGGLPMEMEGGDYQAQPAPQL